MGVDINNCNKPKYITCTCSCSCMTKLASAKYLAEKLICAFSPLRKLDILFQAGTTFSSSESLYHTSDTERASAKKHTTKTVRES